MTTIKMPSEIKAKWVDGLRSGRYKQCEGTLYNDVSQAYCCLGVLEHVCDGEVENDSLPSKKWLNAHNIEFTNTLGHKTYHPYIRYKGELEELTHINDFLKLPFSKIADLIEEQVEGV